MRTINDLGLELVKDFEGCYLESYRCPAGVWTIGYGHTRGVEQGQKITRDKADELLNEDLAECARFVSDLVDVTLTDNQFSALVSFTFNVGSGNLSSSTLLKKLNAGDYEAVPFELARWNKATDPETGRKVPLAGLTRRRAAEGALWLTSMNPRAFENSRGMPQRISDPDEQEITKLR